MIREHELSVEADPGAFEETARMWDTLTGAELIQAMADGRFPQISDINDHIGQVITSAEPGRVDIAWTPAEKLCNPGGTVHGGYIAMILDNAVCLAGSSTCEHFMPMLTLNLNVDYLRGVRAGETYAVTGTCVHPGSTRMVANALVSDAQGRPVAQASASVLPNRAFARK
ncbi:PaaI family thioesterase [Actinomadura nitritigenes]|uniref:PaaI family thioesterase n=1 Tax=Actinomadura nitritigenes TaxID=134602 RepID=A0ABS3R4G8_9ACTN|nr:PaaI family thioesterase [Actinomadura nitritigenes]